MILDTYTQASRSVFYFWVGCISICLLLTFFIRDKGLQRKEEKEEEKAQSSGPISGDDEGSTTEGEKTGVEDANIDSSDISKTKKVEEEV